MIRADLGPEFISRDLDLRACQCGVTLDFSRPGKSTDKRFIEAFDGQFSTECLNAHGFLTLDDTRSKMGEWRKDNNNVLPPPESVHRPRLPDIRCRLQLFSRQLFA